MTGVKAPEKKMEGDGVSRPPKQEMVEHGIENLPCEAFM